MKRVLVLIFLILVTGCGKDKVICNKVQKEEYVTMNQTITINFKGNKVYNAEYKIDAILKDEYKDSGDSFVNVLEGQFSSFEKEYGVKVDINKNDKFVTLKMSLTKENFEKMYLGEVTEIDKENIIKIFEDKEYKCN